MTDRPNIYKPKRPAECCETCAHGVRAVIQGKSGICVRYGCHTAKHGVSNPPTTHCNGWTRQD